MPSIQDRLKKVPPFEDDVKMIQDIKKIAQQNNPQPQPQPDPQPEPEPEEDPKEEETESVEEAPKETPKEAPKEEVKSRTAKQFDKLKEHNQQLKEENKELMKNVLESLRPEQAAPVGEFAPEVYQQIDKHTTDLKPDQVEDIYAGLITKDEFGNPLIDPDLLIKTLREANMAAAQARKEAEIAKKKAEEAERNQDRKFRDFEESREVRRVHKKYPQIDPKNKEFNEIFWDDVRKEIATAPILRGENITFMAAADKIWNERYAPVKEVDEVKKKDREKLDESENQKRNINASIPSSSHQPADYYSKTDQDALREATIAGKKGALAERLRRSGF